MIPFNKPPYTGKETEYLLDAVRGEKLSGDGKYSKLCQEWFEKYLPCPKTLLTRYEKTPAEGCWPLASYGYYGIGTVFEDQIYHLFQSRTAENIELFVKRCNELIQGQLDLSGFKSSTNFEIPEHVYQAKKKRKWYSRLFN